MTEEFKPVAGYEGLYEVSNRGRIYSIRSGKILRPKSNGRGYLQVTLAGNGGHKMAYVHRLVAIAFLPDTGEEVNHKDENVQNNAVENLEWCTRHYNLRFGTRVDRIVQHHKKPVEQLDMNGCVIRVFGSVAEVERLFGYNHSNISNCCNGKLKSAYGSKWRFTLLEG